ncbi:prepilin-type N-terminal cleavage/methylation domain-containing protein [Verrucomicrobiaceae bacterium 5K15]|uniref:Prepilin-type N-terminal cleavage/methylation domain-containing protein n=2 Tax=Oceaniferula flava TaxID=2800421 RepID=A0AAE2SAB2_9BACT|nr:prepilin-type N-terminal cleavage/methylation domain-containing protein [Oceaniferula flavus]MBM1136009.1 prepilin-type N-terminal cleavage/methylation domain-containing protein [Oceaniferula flavus]
MKVPSSHSLRHRGFTLVEITFTVAVLLTLVAITMTVSHGYVQQAQRAGCVMNQDTIRTVLTAHANLTEESFEAGVDYYDSEETRDLFSNLPLCPQGGQYSAKLDAAGENLVVTCDLHGEELE